MFRSLVTPSSTSQSQVDQSSPAEVVPKGFRLLELPRESNLPYWPAAHCRLEFAHCLAGKGITGNVRLVIDALDILPCSRVEGQCQIGIVVTRKRAFVCLHRTTGVDTFAPLRP